MTTAFAGRASRPLPGLLLVSLAGWLLWLLGPPHAMVSSALCGAATGRGLAGVRGDIETALLLNPPGQWVVAWLLMLMAMMPPLLARPMKHVWADRPVGRRCRATVCFLSGYIPVWTLAGLFLMPAAVAVAIFGAGAGFTPLVSAGCAALVWQATPFKQAALRFCDHRPRLSPSGWAADRDCLRYGLRSGLACVGGCWALMLLPNVVHQNEWATMWIVSGIVILERHCVTGSIKWDLLWQGRSRLRRCAVFD